MYLKLNTTFICILISLYLHGQRNNDSIERIYVNSKSQSEIKGKTLTLDEIAIITSKNKDASIYINKAKSTDKLSKILSFTGGFLIGLPIGKTIMGNQNINWSSAVIGCGLLSISFPIYISTQRNSKIAIEKYNQLKISNE